MLSIETIVGLILCGGALGGAAEFLRRFSYSDRGIVLLPEAGSAERPDEPAARQQPNGDRISFISTFILAVLAMVIGCAGALGIQFVLVTLDAAKLNNDPKHQLFLLSISAAAGFGARRLLVSLSARIEDHVKQIDLKATAAGKEARAATKLAEQVSQTALDESQFINEVESVLRGQTGPGTKAHVIRRLEEKIENDPLYGGYAIPFSFILRGENNLDQAIKVIDKFIAAKERKKETDKQYGAALYNKSCFLAVRYGTGKSEADRNAALASLRKALEISESNWSYVLIDKDLDALRGDPEFIKIIEKAPPWARRAQPERGNPEV